MSRKGLMKGMAAVLLILVVGASLVFAATATVFNVENAAPFGVFTSATTTTGVSAGPGAQTAYTFSAPMNSFTCSVVHSGITPTSSVINLEGSIDGTTYRTIATTSTTTTSFVNSTGTFASYLRANWATLTKAAGSTTMTMKCLGKQ